MIHLGRWRCVEEGGTGEDYEAADLIWWPHSGQGEELVIPVRLKPQLSQWPLRTLSFLRCCAKHHTAVAAIEIIAGSHRGAA